MAALAILLGYVEWLIPVVPPIAGIKLGLGNIAILLALRVFPYKRVAVSIMLVKVMVCALLFAGIGGLPYSLGGGACSLMVMLLLRRNRKLSAAGISAVGGAVHMAAQTAVAAALTMTPEVLFLAPLLVAVGTFTGLLNGVIVNSAEKHAGRYFREQGVSAGMGSR